MCLCSLDADDNVCPPISTLCCTASCSLLSDGELWTFISPHITVGCLLSVFYAWALKVAAETGDINGLYGSIKEDSHVLDRIDAIPFVDTPLHTAASAGHTDFAIEILRLKPSFGRKLNPDGLSSLHLALINDKFETVKRLIKFDKELIQVKGREGANSLH
ncbi:hypothetical protein Vadar_011770 [Vaccinium darrowii]|uniref:Uncharacterized protein n=1 Tax=Vaccinium darrowii TaxID=229202 RepID=A0ACB7ZJ01_9ERIC|nr:hypothetical protein Vadar_011770 [Vaccinium darrowii]